MLFFMRKLPSHYTIICLCFRFHSSWCLLARDSPYPPEPLFAAPTLILISTSEASVGMELASGFPHSPRHQSHSFDSEDYVTNPLVSKQLLKYCPQYPCVIGQLECHRCENLCFRIAHTPDLLLMSMQPGEVM